MRRLIVSLVGASALLLALPPAMAEASHVSGHLGRVPVSAPTCGEEWGVMLSPSPAGGSELQGVSAISAKDVWSVGVTFAGVLLTEHWDGTAWSIVSTPNPGPPGGQDLFAVSGAASNDVWAVGYYNDPNGVTSPLILHWDGNEWTQATVPVQAGHVYELFGVKAISATDVWAVGIANAGSGTAISSSDRLLSLAFHYDGVSWTRVQTPDPDQQNFFQAVTAVSSTDVWAVGNHFAAPNYIGKPMTAHWNGKRWKLVPTPDVPGNVNLQGVSAVGSKDVWTVGQSSGQSGTTTLAMHWDGTGWTVFPTPNPGSTNQLFGVSASTSDNVYAAGDVIGAPGLPQQAALIERWDGVSWHVVNNPNPSSDVNFLYAIDGRHSGAAWAVGNDFNIQTFQEDTLIETTPAC